MQGLPCLKKPRPAPPRPIPPPPTPPILRSHRPLGFPGTFNQVPISGRRPVPGDQGRSVESLSEPSWGRGRGQGAGGLRPWGGARSAQSGAIGHPWQEPHLGQQQRRPRECPCGARRRRRRRRGPAGESGARRGDRGRGLCAADPAPRDRTKGSARGRAAEERLGNKCERGSGGGDAGPGR